MPLKKKKKMLMLMMVVVMTMDSRRLHPPIPEYHTQNDLLPATAQPPPHPTAPPPPPYSHTPNDSDTCLVADRARLLHLQPRKRMCWRTIGIHCARYLQQREGSFRSTLPYHHCCHYHYHHHHCCCHCYRHCRRHCARPHYVHSRSSLGSHKVLLLVESRH